MQLKVVVMKLLEKKKVQVSVYFKFDAYCVLEHESCFQIILSTKFVALWSGSGVYSHKKKTYLLASIMPVCWHIGIMPSGCEPY